MELIYLVYGLAFFLLGFAILLYPKKGSALELSGSINLVAFFGIFHGINEWLDLFLLIGYPEDRYIPEVMRSVTLPLSFLFLVYFGFKVLGRRISKPKLGGFLTVAVSGIFLAAYFSGSRTMDRWDIWSRYILCVPGAFLSGLALLVYVPHVEPARVKKITLNLKTAGFAFMAYALLAGVIVKKADFFPASFLNYDSFKDLSGGVPVQIFRAGCAVIMAYSLIRVLEIFHWEIKRDLYESQFRFSAIAKQAPVILFTTDTKNIVTFVEGKGLEGLGLSGADIIGRPITSVFEGSGENAESFGSDLAGGDSLSTIFVKDCVLQLFYGPLEVGGHIEGAIGVGVDITAQYRAQAELEDYRERMLEQKTLAEIGTISTEMVQKLSMPVASIKASLLTALVALRKMPNNANLRQPLENSLDQSSRAMEIIDKFFNFANITPNPQAEPIDIDKIVNRVLAVFRDRINQAMIKVETSGIDAVPCMFISSHEMEQVFFTVLQNAVHSADGKQVGELSIRCKLSENNFMVVFSGNLGLGDYENPNDIFEPFSTTEEISSTNSFGLVVLKRLVLAYNGEIEAKRHGDLTIIEMSLPVEKL